MGETERFIAANSAAAEHWKEQLARVKVDSHGEPSWANRLSNATEEIAAGIEPVGGPRASVPRTYRTIGCLLMVTVPIGLFLIVTAIAACIDWWVHHL